jgi:hypothetical protein
LLVTILHFEVIHLCRLWDPPERKGYSIPTLALVANDPDVLANVEVRIAEQIKNRADSVRIAAENRAKLTAALANAEEIALSGELRRLRNYRHKLAHSVLKTDVELRRHIDMPTALDADVVIGGTIPVMSIISSTDFDFASDLATERQGADQFFAALGPAIRAVVPDRT